MAATRDKTPPAAFPASRAHAAKHPHHRAKAANRAQAARVHAHLAALVASSDDAIISKTLSGVITSWNPGAERLFGYSAEESLGRTMLRLFPPEREHEEAAILARIACGQTVSHFEAVRVRKDGSHIDVSVSISPIRDESGAVIGVSTVARDITERTRVERALRASELRARQIFETAPNAMLVVAAGGWIEDANTAAERVFGCRARQLIGQALEALLPSVTGALSRAEPPSGGSVLQLSPMGGGMNVVARRADGREFPVEVGMGQMEIDGRTCVVMSVVDLSERRSAAAALAHSEERLRLFFEHAPSAMAMFDCQMRYLAASQRWLSDHGLLGRPVIGQPHQMLSPQTFARWKDAHQRALRGEVVGVDDDPFARSDGSVQWLKWEVRPWMDPHGVVAGTIIVSADISDRKHAEDEVRRLNAELERRVGEQAVALRQRERDLKSILDHMPSMIGYWDASLRNRFGNLAYHEWFGIDPDTMPGMHIREVIGEERFALNWPYIEGALRGETQFFERSIALPNEGGVRHSQAQYFPDVADDGSVQGFYVQVTDVTPIKEAQARAAELLSFTEAVIQNSAVGIAVYQANGACVLANAALAAVVGTSQEGLLAQNFRCLKSWAVSGLLRQADATLKDAQPRNCEVHTSSTAGREVWAEVSLAAIDRGGRRHLLAIVHDVQAQRKAQAELAAGRDAAEAAARTKSSFLANMSHEIRTPMNAIVGLSRLAMEGDLEPRARDYLGKVHSSAVALMGILDDVLDYSKIESGQLRFESIEFDLDDLLERVADLFAARIKQKGLELVFEVAPEVPLLLRGDPLRLSQVINNLVGNAVKFTEEGSVQLSVSLLERDGPDCRLRFAVCDTGMGIAADRLHSLFEPFTQADNSITRRFGGSGLGLTICKHLVQQMQGEIGVESTWGRGSEFIFSVMLGAADDAARVNDLHQVAGMRALVVDDCELSTRVISSQLEAWHLIAHQARDGIAALEQVCAADRAGRPYDLILLDWQMPGLDGLQTLRCLRERVSAGHLLHTPLVVMMTAHGRESLLSAVETQCPDVALVKPLLMPVLFDAVLRARRGVAAHAPAMPSRSEPLIRLAEPLRGAQVLLVEDNEVNQLVASEFLSRLGLQVTVAADGKAAVDAVQAAASGHYAAVLMDLHMPVMDGFEATRRIRDLPAAAKLPVIAMSAAALPEDRARCFEAGMVDHVAKPVIPERLVEVLLHWVRPVQANRTALAAPPMAPVVECAPVVVPQLAGFDLPGLMARVHGNLPLVRNLLGEYLRTEAGTCAAVVQLIAAEQIAQARERVHQLKGVSANLGAVAVAASCVALESVLKDGTQNDLALSAALRNLCETLSGSMQTLRAQLERWSKPAPSVLQGAELSPVARETERPFDTFTSR